MPDGGATWKYHQGRAAPCPEGFRGELRRRAERPVLRSRATAEGGQLGPTVSVVLSGCGRLAAQFTFEIPNRRHFRQIHFAQL
jgi:hypothetical protein